MTQLKFVTAIVLCAVSFSGCMFYVGARAGATGAIYYKGNMKDELPHSASEVYEAALQALSDQALPISKQKQDPYRGEIKSEFPDRKNIWITITALSDQSSNLKIRVGIGGDQKRAYQLLVRIKDHLQNDPLLEPLS